MPTELMWEETSDVNGYPRSANGDGETIDLSLDSFDEIGGKGGDVMNPFKGGTIRESSSMSKKCITKKKWNKSAKYF